MFIFNASVVWAPAERLAWVIGLNDLLVGNLLVSSIRHRCIRPPVLAWSGVWLLAVTLVRLTSLDVFVA